MGLSTFFSNQARRPSGFFGRLIMPLVFDRGNAFLNGLVETCMAVEPGDRVLEIGCGTGKLINMMAAGIDTGMIEGIDFSPTMAAIARRRNKKQIARGAVTIRDGDFDKTAWTRFQFTKACSVNTIYFWKHPEQTANRVFNLLEPGGRFIVAFEDIGQLKQRKLSHDVFRLYTTDDVRRLLTRGGFSKDIVIESRKKHSLLFHCVMAKR